MEIPDFKKLSSSEDGCIYSLDLNRVFIFNGLVYKFGNSSDTLMGERDIDLSEEARALELVKDIPRTQQIVEYNSSKNILITKYVKGYNFDLDSSEFKTGILPYNQEQVDDLFETLYLMSEKGVYFDTFFTNLFYDSEKGFTPIDYGFDDFFEKRINFNNVYNILSLKNIRDRFRFEAPPLDGLNRHLHVDTVEMMEKSFEKYFTGDMQFFDYDLLYN